MCPLRNRKQDAAPPYLADGIMACSYSGTKSKLQGPRRKLIPHKCTRHRSKPHQSPRNTARCRHNASCPKTWGRSSKPTRSLFLLQLCLSELAAKYDSCGEASCALNTLKQSRQESEFFSLNSVKNASAARRSLLRAAVGA